MNVTYYYGSTMPTELQIMHAQIRSQWENEVASLLKSDMRSLTQEEEGGTMTMQERVIQSGNET